ncbi:hypothetical protein AB0C34_17220 [Nocardia sp. NPDC049220]|uniref:hypothetical protein n=1 Tax=Nocardia sp. NPDC049220 TaxID=3155273 RepID=UPI0033C429D2
MKGREMHWENTPAQLTDAEVRALALHDPDEEWELRADFTPAAAELADALRSTALGTVEGDGYGCGHGATWLLPPHLLQVPAPLAQAIAGVELGLPEGPWPEFGRTQCPIDWPELIDAHPDALTWNHAMLENNLGAGADAISTAYRILAARGCRPSMDVCLWVESDARIAIEPLALFADDTVVDVVLRGQVDEILVASGRPRNLLRDDEPGGYWCLEAA